MKSLCEEPVVSVSAMTMNQDITMLIRRSNEIQAALSERDLTREEVRWCARIALASLPENELKVPRWRWWFRVRRLMQPT